MAVAKGELKTVPKEHADKFLSLFMKPNPKLKEILSYKPIHKYNGECQKDE